MEKTKLRDLVRTFLEENPTIKENRKLAKMLHSKYPLLFKTVDSARGVVRGVQGLSGKQSIDKKGVSVLFVEKLAELRAKHNIVTETEMDLSPYVLNSRFKRPLILSDTHFPYTDMKALDIALDDGYKSGCDSIIINGDFEDFKTLAKFLSKPNAMRAIETMEGAKDLLKYIKESLGVKTIYHEGNHTVRWEHYLLRNAPEFWGLADITLKGLYDCAKQNIDYVENERYMNVGKLAVAHGNHIVKGIFAPVNAARGVFTKTNSSTLIGHVHRTSEHIETDIHGKVIGCWSTGCLTNVRPEYNPQVSKHNHGFAIVDVDKNGDFEVLNKKIINYKIK